MNGSKCLLDTSVIIHVFRKHNAVSGQLDGMKEIYVPVTVVGELYYGAYNRLMYQNTSCRQTCF